MRAACCAASSFLDMFAATFATLNMAAANAGLIVTAVLLLRLALTGLRGMRLLIFWVPLVGCISPWAGLPGGVKGR